MHTVVDIIVFAAGFAICWVCKDDVRRAVTGACARITAILDWIKAPRSNV